MPTKKVKHTQPLFGEASALGYLIMVPGASALIRQNGVACSVYSNAAGTAMTNPVPTGVPVGTAGVDVNGTLLVFLDPGPGYDGQATVGAAVSTFTIPDIPVDVTDTADAAATTAALAAKANDNAVLKLTGDQTATGHKTLPTGATVGAAGAPNDVMVRLATAPRNPGGLKGLELERGAAGGAMCLVLMTNGATDWGIGVDLNTGANADLVLAYDASVSADVMRVRKGAPWVAIANTAMPSPGSRLLLASNGIGTDNAALRYMLSLSISDPDSPCTHLIRALAPGAVFGVTKAGWIGAGTDTPAAPLQATNPGAATTTVGDGLRLQLNSTGDPGWIVWGQGTSVQDWRIGRNSSNHLVVYSANGVASNPSAPGTKVMHFTLTGLVGIGTAAGSTPANARLNVVDTIVRGATPSGGLIVSDSAAQGAGVGGQILFEGNYTDAGATGRLAGLRMEKENATSGNYSAALVFLTANNGASLSEKVRITALGVLGIGTAAPGASATAGEVELSTTGKGIIMKSPDGTRYRVTVANGGTLAVAAA